MCLLYLLPQPGPTQGPAPSAPLTRGLGSKGTQNPVKAVFRRRYLNGHSRLRRCFGCANTLQAMGVRWRDFDAAAKNHRRRGFSQTTMTC